MKTAQSSLAQRVVLIALCLSAIISNVQRNCLGAAESMLRSEFDLGRSETGWIMGAFFLTYALSQVPAGWLGGYWGTRLGLPVFMTISSLCMGAFGLANGFVVLVGARLAMGAAQAGTLPCCVNTISHWFPQSKCGFASGMLGAALSIGGALGADLTARLVGLVGLRTTFLLYALPGFIWSAWFWLWFRDRPEDELSTKTQEINLTEASRSPGERTPWEAILTSPSIWWICGQQLFRAAGYIFFASWFTTYLQEARGINLATAGWMTSLPFLAVVAAGPLGGLLSDWLLTRTGSRRLGRQAVAVVCQSACAGLILLARPVSENWLAVAMIVMGSFLSSLGGLSYVVTIEMSGRHVPVVFGIMNMAGNIGAFLFPILVPLLLGDPVNPNWDRVLYAFAGVHGLSAICWLCLNPNRTIVPDQNDVGVKS
jgi:ACS family glucarate transporter-like MFS transporter/ACS family D-galactonate transporter-like MFS transporter